MKANKVYKVVNSINSQCSADNQNIDDEDEVSIVFYKFIQHRERLEHTNLNIFMQTDEHKVSQLIATLDNEVKSKLQSQLEVDGDFIRSTIDRGTTNQGDDNGI